ncbi:MAG TPA: DMT family transporter [Xanthomonadaceae bacterium]|nr:DMT family transporter [Xanthomonadaceae bacterium]
MLVVAVLAMSWAGPLVRFTAAPAEAVAAWRLVLSVGLIAVLVALRPASRRAVRELRGQAVLAVVAGVLLAAHFWSWIASLRLTTISSSVVLVSTQPLFVAGLAAVFLGERPGRRGWMGIGVAIAGAALIGWGDFQVGGRALAGDALAVAGAIFAAGYYVIGRRLRVGVDLWAYTLVVYGVAAIVLMGVVVLGPAPVSGYAGRDWLVFAALAVGPMMLGHTGVNYALRYLPAYLANLMLVGEPVGATAIAWLLPAIGEVPSGRTVAGAALILIGIAVGASRHGVGAKRHGGEAGVGPS